MTAGMSSTAVRWATVLALEYVFQVDPIPVDAVQAALYTVDLVPSLPYRSMTHPFFRIR